MPPLPADRLDSWKEIAAYANRGVRTMRRWEREEGLPVHRHVHRRLGSVYAYKSEIDAWRQTRTEIRGPQRARLRDGEEIRTEIRGPQRARLRDGEEIRAEIRDPQHTRLSDGSKTELRHPRPRSTAALRAAAALGRMKSIAVLPFTNLSTDPENAYFADGLTDEVTAHLSKVRALRVISRTSSMTFRGTTKDVKTIAGELAVRYVLEGSVRRAGSRLRITAQLIDASTDDHVWADTYDGTVEDVFAIQERLARVIVDALELQLTADEERRIAERPRCQQRGHAAPAEQLLPDIRPSVDRTAAHHAPSGSRSPDPGESLHAGVG